MASSILILSNSDSGLYDFRKEVLKALMEKGFHVLGIRPGYRICGAD